MQNTEQQKQKPTVRKFIQAIGMLVVLAAVVLVGIVVIFFWSATKVCPTQVQYLDAGGSLPFAVPEDAADQRYVIYRTTFSKTYLYSFVLDADALEAYITTLTTEHSVGKTEDDMQYGYGRWYGKKVADCCDPSYPADNFPVSLPFAEVTEEAIEDYEVVLYSPSGTGSRSSAVVADRNTGRIVVYTRSGM